MKATLITYTAKGLSKTESSKLSKALVGYKDKSNNAKYVYNRAGILKFMKAIIICKSAFIVPKNKAGKVISLIKKRGGKILFWNMNLPEKYFKI